MLRRSEGKRADGDVAVLSASPMLVFLVIRAYLQALSVTRPMLAAMVVANIVNFFGDLVLVFGYRSIPALGCRSRAFDCRGHSSRSRDRRERSTTSRRLASPDRRRSSAES
jgi:hypothetical protein